MSLTCPFFVDNGLLYGEVLAKNDLAYFMSAADLILTVSGIIIPFRHVPTPFDLTTDEWSATWELLHVAKETFDRSEPDGYTLGWNVGQVGGQDVFHAHFHVIARFADEPLAGRGLRYAFKQQANRRPNHD